MNDLLLIAAGTLTGLFWLGALAATLYAVRKVPRLDAMPLPAPPEAGWPRVSLIRPACNEAARLEAATRQALALDYPDLQVVLIDDRSTDDTPQIVDRLAEDHRVQAVHIDELPSGWLGKLNAMQQGVTHADGEWFLFADADSHFSAGTLQRAIGWADDHELDFVSVLPGVERAGFLADAAFSAANSLLAAGTKPWNIAHDDDSAAATGAFMLVRREAFERTPGFEWLRLEVADDFGLCLMVKRHGGRAGFFVAPQSVRLKWYEDFGDMVVSMQKNFFAISGRFSLARCLFQGGVLVAISVGPFLPLLAISSPSALPIATVALGAGITNGLVTAWWTDRPLLSAALPWVGMLATAFIVVRAGLVGVRQGGIVWRGVLYRTEELRDAQRVRF